MILPVNFDTIGTVEFPRHTDSDRIVPVLLDLARNDPHIRVRTEAAASLGHLDSPAARRALIQLMERK